MISRLMLKTKAKAAINESKPSPLIAGLLVVGIMVVITLVNSFSNYNAYMDMINEYTAANPDASFGELMEQIYDITLNSTTSVAEHLILRFFQLVSLYITFGLSCYSLAIARGRRDTPISSMFPSFLLYLKFLLMSILMYLLIVFGTVLFIVPGIIFAMQYSMSKYILIENPGWNVITCMKESRRLMKGHKWEYLVLTLSFIMWYFLTVLTTITGVWTYPYIEITYAHFYDELTQNDVLLNKTV